MVNKLLIEFVIYAGYKVFTVVDNCYKRLLISMQ